MFCATYLRASSYCPTVVIWVLHGLVGSTGLGRDASLLALITHSGTIAFSLTGIAHVNNFFVYAIRFESFNST